AVLGHQLAQLLLARVAEGRMPDVVAERDRLDQRLVQLQRASDRARDLRDLERVGHARAEVVAGAVDEDLRLVFEAAERAAVDDAVAVAREVGAVRVGGLGMLAAAARAGEQRIRGEVAPLDLLEVRARPWHAAILGPPPRTSSARAAASAGRAAEEVGADALALAPDLLRRRAQVAEDPFREGERDLALARDDRRGAAREEAAELAHVGRAREHVDLRIQLARVADHLAAVLDLRGAE